MPLLTVNLPEVVKMFELHDLEKQSKCILIRPMCSNCWFMWFAHENFISQRPYCNSEPERVLQRIPYSKCIELWAYPAQADKAEAYCSLLFLCSPFHRELSQKQASVVVNFDKITKLTSSNTKRHKIVPNHAESTRQHIRVLFVTWYSKILAFAGEFESKFWYRSDIRNVDNVH